jgi:hypothetical protein
VLSSASPGTTPFVVSAIIVLFAWLAWGILYFPETLWAPGDLSRFHSDITACTDCHQPFRGAIPDKCIGCHSDKYFTARSKPQSSEFHHQSIREREAYMDCHTEHRGAFAQITIGALFNPHGEFVFRATGAKSCRACHDFSGGVQSQPNLLDNGIVRHLIEEGDGAHKSGKMLRCLKCHLGGRVEVEDDD